MRGVRALSPGVGAHGGNLRRGENYNRGTVACYKETGTRKKEKGKRKKEKGESKKEKEDGTRKQDKVTSHSLVAPRRGLADNTIIMIL